MTTYDKATAERLIAEARKMADSNYPPSFAKIDAALTGLADQLEAGRQGGGQMAAAIRDGDPQFRRDQLQHGCSMSRARRPSRRGRAAA